MSIDFATLEWAIDQAMDAASRAEELADNLRALRDPDHRIRSQWGGRRQSPREEAGLAPALGPKRAGAEKRLRAMALAAYAEHQRELRRVRRFVRERAPKRKAGRKP